MKEKPTVGEESQLLDSEHPWPGLRPFTEENASYFFGREQEIDDIVRKVKQETLTLLFGKSGLGKTSLLRAGVSPQLRKSGFIPIYIRLNHFEDSLNLEDQVEVFMEEVLDAGRIDAPRPIREETLWEHFHKKDGDWWDEENRLVKPVLIFDQFEEILTSGQENPVRAARSAAFLAELEDMIENRPPAHLLERFKAEKGLAKAYDFERIDYRVVISIREDYLADLEDLRERLRTITKNRYRLLPLNDLQAMNIIMKPGGHLVDDAVANDIIRFVSSPATIPLSENLFDHSMPRQVESALLSIILSELNNHRIDAKKEKISSDLVVNRRPEDILLEFYEDSLKGLGSNARLFVENQLLTASGGRNRVAETDAKDRHGLNEELIDTLINRRIIQREKTARRSWIELTHDSLAPVVQRCAEANRRKRRMRRMGVYAAVVLVIVMALGATWVQYLEQDKRHRAQTVADFIQDVAWDLRGIYAISMKGQNRILDRLNEELNKFPEEIKDTKKFKACNARFLLTWAAIQIENGYFGRASEKLKKAQKLLLEGRAGEAQDTFSKLTVVSFELLQAEIESVNGNSKLSWQALHRAEKLFSLVSPSDSGQSKEISELQHRMNRIRIDLLAGQGNWDEVAAQSKKARTAILSELPGVDDNGESIVPSGADESDHIHWRQLSSELFRIHFKKASLARLLNRPLCTDTYFEYEKDLENTKALFSDDDTLRHWYFFNALKFRVAALKHQLDGNTIEARSAIDIAINNFADLVRDNEDNLQYRYNLGMALLHRAELSGKQDPRQADIDIETARKLAFTLRRDSAHPYLPLTLCAEADYYELLAGNDKSGKQIDSVNRFIARIESYREEFSGSDVFVRWTIGSHFAGIKILIKGGDKARALELSDAALDSIESQKDNWDEAFLSNRRFWIHQAIVTAENADEIENERWKYHYKGALAEAKFLLQLYPDNRTWAYYETNLLGLRADRYRRKENRTEAIQAYEKMAVICHDYSVRYPDQKIISVNSIYALYQLITLYQADGNWLKVVGAADLLLKHVDPGSDREIQYPANELKFWQWAQKYLKAAHQEMLKSSGQSLKDTGLDNPARTTLSRKTLDRMDKALTEFSGREKYLQGLIAKQQTEAAAKPDKKAEQIDLRVLDLPEVKKDAGKDRFIASQSLSWRVPSMYPGASSYALTGEDFDKIAALIPEKDLHGKTIHRIRSSGLSFYDNAQLLTVEFDKESNPDLTKLYLKSGDQIHELNGKSLPIHRANKEFPIRLETKDHVAAYLRFFCTFLKGNESEGTFFPVMSGKDFSWSNDATQERKQKIESLIRPMSVWTEPDQPDTWYAISTIAYSKALFYAKFRIEKSGKVEMINDLPIAGDLPIEILKFASNREASNYLSRINLDLISGIDLSDTKKEIKKLKDLAKEYSDRADADWGMSVQVDHLRSIVNEMMALEQPGLPEKMTLKNIRSARKVYASALELIGKASSKIDFMENPQIKSYLTKSRETIEKIHKEGDSAKIKDLANACLGLSFFQIKIRDFEGALETAARGIDVDPGYLQVYINYAHALLFLGKTSEAMEIHQQNKGKPIEHKTWDYSVLDDFSRFEKLGLSIPEMDQVRHALKK